MGVLMCSRKGCKNIICDRYSHVHGYICPDCFNELISLNPESVGGFMETIKKGSDLSEDAETKFEREFPCTHGGG